MTKLPARFTHFHKGSPVVVSTKNLPCEFVESYPTEEGSHYASHYFFVTSDGKLMHEWDRHDVDCDGPLSQNGKGVWNGFEFERVTSSQRDYYAEAMGY